ncbi:MAG: 16S rRNA (guanine(527)-N(7))-methyltransferase RsmG [Pseudomonadota bacterium]
MSPAQHALLAQYVALLQQWNTRINLMAQDDMAGIWARHIDDSLQLLPLLKPDNWPILDLGSGAGFPGMILGIVTDRPVILVEATAKKARFLRHIARSLQLSDRVKIAECRIETIRLSTPTLITARGLADLSQLCAFIHMIANGHPTKSLFMKGKTWESELTDARRKWDFACHIYESRTLPQARILRIETLRGLETLRKNSLPQAADTPKP